MNEKVWEKSCNISPSLITLDMCNLEQQTKILEENGIEMLHVDILDGHFSPSMPLGLDTVKQLRKKTNLEFEAHVMVKEPQFFIDAGFLYEDVTNLIVTNDMSERKAKMIELGDAFIAFPGGTGTLEEITEIMSKVSLGHLAAPCILYNLNGYYDSLRDLLRHMVEKDLSTEERQQGIYFAESLSEIRELVGE